MNERTLKNTPEHKVNITNEKWKSNHSKLGKMFCVFSGSYILKLTVP